jgi:hypothetical protein
MSRTTESLAGTLSAVLLFALAITDGSGGAARAADNCLAAPKAAPPQGSHWYYRFDRAKARKCWYLGPKGQKVRQAVPQINLPTTRSAPPGDTADREALPPESGDKAFNTTRTISDPVLKHEYAGQSWQLAGSGMPAFVQWPGPQPVASTTHVDADIRGVIVPAKNDDSEAQVEALQQRAGPVPPARLIHPESVRRIKILLLVAGAAAGGFLVTVIVSAAVPRRRRDHINPGSVNRYVDRVDVSDRSALPVAIRNNPAQPTLSSNIPRDEKLRPHTSDLRQRQFGRALEHRAA